MTVVDSSALFAILLKKPDADKYARAIEADERPSISAATLFEAGAVALGRGGLPLLQQLRTLVGESEFEVVPFSAHHADIAMEAYRRYGRGVGEPPCLNVGDCFAYALAKHLNQPLLFKGDDFGRTDIRSAL